MDKKKIIPKILLDLSKAFDSTDHDRLLYKICYTATVYGHVIGYIKVVQELLTALELLIQILSGCSQAVRFGSTAVHVH